MFVHVKNSSFYHSSPLRNGYHLACEDDRGMSEGGGFALAVSGTLGAETRRSTMVERLATRGRLLLNETAEEWGVHPMTIRRDFEILEDTGLARRVRGGLVHIGSDGFSQRQHRSAGAKRRIAEKLVDLVGDGMAIGFDASTTVFQ